MILKMIEQGIYIKIKYGNMIEMLQKVAGESVVDKK